MMLNVRGMSTVENFLTGVNRFGHGLTSDLSSRLRLLKNGFSFFTSLAIRMPVTSLNPVNYMPDQERCQLLRSGIFRVCVIVYGMKLYVVAESGNSNTSGRKPRRKL